MHMPMTCSFGCWSRTSRYLAITASIQSSAVTPARSCGFVPWPGSVSECVTKPAFFSRLCIEPRSYCVPPRPWMRKTPSGVDCAGVRRRGGGPHGCVLGARPLCVTPRAAVSKCARCPTTRCSWPSWSRIDARFVGRREQRAVGAAARDRSCVSGSPWPRDALVEARRHALAIVGGHERQPVGERRDPLRRHADELAANRRSRTMRLLAGSHS